MRYHPGRNALRALPALASKGWYRQLTTATTLCTGRAAPLSTCGNKPACGNARLVTNKNGARGSVVQCGINPGRNALRALPAPCQQAFVPPAAATTLCIGRATSHCLDPSQEKKEPHYAIEITPVSVAGSRKGSTGPPGSSAGCPPVHHSVTASSPLARSGDHWSPSPVAARYSSQSSPAGYGPLGVFLILIPAPCSGSEPGAAPARCPPRWLRVLDAGAAKRGKRASQGPADNLHNGSWGIPCHGVKV